MKITSPKFEDAQHTVNEEALLRCQAALDLKDKGDYEGAKTVMQPFWPMIGQRPNTDGLHPTVAAEVLLTTGILTCWVASKIQSNEAKESARDLIPEIITFYESFGDVKKVAMARSELGYCYWCEGELNEARIIFNEALTKLTALGNTRARALLGLAVVEWSASRHKEALQILMDNASLFKNLKNAATKGAYYSQLGMVRRNLASSENKKEYFQQAIRDYQEADLQFKLAQNIIFRSDVKNNVGFLLFKLSRCKEAHAYLQDARRLTIRIRDKVRTAQIDDTRAQVLIAEKKFKEAETVAKSAVRVFEKSGHQCLLADALITHATALGRLKQTERAQFTFQKAIEVAQQVGALNKAGTAALTLLEEVEDLSIQASYAAYDRASEWLDKSQSQELLLRLNAAGRKVVLRLWEELKQDNDIEAILNKPCHLHTEVLKYEASLVRRALAQANGSVTKAAKLLDVSYQGLAYVINSRHPDLLKERSPVRRRGRRDPEAENKPSPKD